MPKFCPEDSDIIEQDKQVQIAGKTWEIVLCAEPADEEAERFFQSLPEKLKAVTQPRDLSRYIYIQVLDEMGKVSDFTLLRYHATDAAQLNADWEKLEKGDITQLSDLSGWYLKLRNGMGYFRTGGHIIYN